jgi:hypothetical protein
MWRKEEAKRMTVDYVCNYPGHPQKKEEKRKRKRKKKKKRRRRRKRNTNSKEKHKNLSDFPKY